MQVTLNQLETAFLGLQINKMAKSIKKGLKLSYGKAEGKKQAEVFNEIRELINEQIDKNEVENIIEFSMKQIRFLDTFLHWYEGKLQEEYQKEKKTTAFKKLKEDDFEAFIKELRAIQQNIEEVLPKRKKAKITIC